MATSKLDSGLGRFYLSKALDKLDDPKIDKAGLQSRFAAMYDDYAETWSLSGNVMRYTGILYDGDEARFQDLLEQAPEGFELLINSPGGEATAGCL